MPAYATYKRETATLTLAMQHANKTLHLAPEAASYPCTPEHMMRVACNDVCAL